MEVAHLVALFLRTLTLLVVVLASSTSTIFAQATSTPTPAPSGPTATPVACVKPTVGVNIELENPQPGDTLLTGTQVVMNGIAFDTGSTSGPGISSVTIYLGARDAGGTSLGTATLGQPNPRAAPGSPLATAGFTLRTPALPSGSGARSIFVYARSQIGNAEGVLEVPVFLNTAPTPVRGQVPTPVLPPPPVCTPVPSATATAAATDTPVAPPAVPTLPPTSTTVPLPATPPVPGAAPGVGGSPTSTPAAAVPPAEPIAPPAAAEAPTPTAAQTAAPRGGGIPAELGLLVLALGVAVVGGGMALRRRERRD
jgi:hypothetical protein